MDKNFYLGTPSQTWLKENNSIFLSYTLLHYYRHLIRAYKLVEVKWELWSEFLFVCVRALLCISVMFLHLSEMVILLMLLFLVIRLLMKLLKLLFYLMCDYLGSRGENEAVFSCDAWGSCSAFSSKHWRGISIIFHLINLCQSYFWSPYLLFCWCWCWDPSLFDSSIKWCIF